VRLYQSLVVWSGAVGLDRHADEAARRRTSQMLAVDYVER